VAAVRWGLWFLHQEVLRGWKREVALETGPLHLAVISLARHRSLLSFLSRFFSAQVSHLSSTGFIPARRHRLNIIIGSIV